MRYKLSAENQLIPILILKKWLITLMLTHQYISTWSCMASEPSFGLSMISYQWKYITFEKPNWYFQFNFLNSTILDNTFTHFLVYSSVCPPLDSITVIISTCILHDIQGHTMMSIYLHRSHKLSTCLPFLVSHWVPCSSSTLNRRECPIGWQCSVLHQWGPALVL